MVADGSESVESWMCRPASTPAAPRRCSSGVSTLACAASNRSESCWTTNGAATAEANPVTRARGPT